MQFFTITVFLLSLVKIVFPLSPVCVEKNKFYSRADNWKSIFNIQKYVRILHNNRYRRKDKQRERERERESEMERDRSEIRDFEKAL